MMIEINYLFFAGFMNAVRMAKISSISLKRIDGVGRNVRIHALMNLQYRTFPKSSNIKELFGESLDFGFDETRYCRYTERLS